MADKLFNENILDQIRHGIAKFELVSSPVSSIATPSVSHTLSAAFLGDNSNRFFARIGPSLGGGSPATKKVEHFAVHKVTGDGRCLFRALVKGMAFNKGIALSPREERDDAGKSMEDGIILTVYAAPQQFSKFYLSAYLDSLKGSGWSIFLVRGNFPKECPISSSEASNGYGQWLSPEDAERITKS